MKWRSVVLVSLATAALASAATWMITYQPLAGDGGGPEGAGYAPVPSEFTDPRPVTATVTPPERAPLRTARAGTVTHTTCVVGTRLATGDVPVVIDQVPLPVILSSSPLFRDLRGGEKGDDVVALQESLRQWGAEIEVSGIFDWSTRQAIAGFLRSAGQSPVNGQWGVLDRSAVLWSLPERAEVASCPPSVGDVVAPDGAVIELVSEAPRVEVSLPSGSAAGARVLIVGDVRVPLDEDRRVTDHDALSELLATPDGRAALASEEGTLPATAELSQPITTYGVPPSALITDDRSPACVVDEETSYPVEIVASSLGVSYVTFVGARPERVLAIPGDRACI